MPIRLFCAIVAALLSSVAFAAPQEAQTPKASTPQPGPKDKPVTAKGADGRKKLEKAIAPYVAQAKKTYPAAKARFLKGLPKGQQFFVTYVLRDTNGKQQEQVFIAVQTIKGGKISGAISSSLDNVRTFKRGQIITFAETDLLDWTITHPDGTEEGNVVGKFLDTYKP